MKQRKKKSVKFLQVFFLSVIITLFIVFTASSFIVGTLVRFFPEIFRHMWLVFIWNGAVWSLIGYYISRFFGKKLFDPIQRLNRATKEIAEGNFQARIEEETNITEIQEMTNSFNRMAAELESTEMIHSDFTRNVSHEFKTPLSVIKGYARILQKEQITDSERIRYAVLITESADRLTSLTNNILLLSKLENQEIQLECKMVDIAEQIRKALLLYEEQWSSKNIDLDIDMPEIAAFNGNEDLLFQVWQNLIGNAIKFTKENGHIEITISETVADVTVIFKDNGIGISTENQKRIFEKFYQADQSHAAAGNGLGLPLTKRIVEFHGGNISVQSEEGHGSTFTIYLPKHYK